METVPARILTRFLSRLTEESRLISDIYANAEYSFKGPHGKGIYLSKEMNAQARYIYLVSEDHSLRAYVYVDPEEDRKLPPCVKTYIFTNPAFFFIGMEGPRGNLRVTPWEKEMLTAGIPERFIKASRAEVKAAIEKYGT